MSELIPLGNNGTTKSAPNRPTPAAGNILRIILSEPWTDLIMNIDVRTTGVRSKNSLMLLSVGLTMPWTCGVNKFTKLLDSGPTYWTSTLPRHRLKKTRDALILPSIRIITGKSMIAPKIIAGFMLSF